MHGDGDGEQAGVRCPVCHTDSVELSDLREVRLDNQLRRRRHPRQHRRRWSSAKRRLPRSIPTARSHRPYLVQRNGNDDKHLVRRWYDSDLSLNPRLPQPAPTPTPTPSPVSSVAASPVRLVRGFDGTCLRDMGDSTAPRTKVVIWACDPTAQGQGWTCRADELIIHGRMCVNAKGLGRSGSVVILWPRNGSPNESWVHRPNGEYVLKANGRRLCLEDPAYSVKNGTQLVVAACSGERDQLWSLPHAGG
jgi:Ricin-type beta-trefoil lectin domain